MSDEPVAGPVETTGVLSTGSRTGFGGFLVTRELLQMVFPWWLASRLLLLVVALAAMVAHHRSAHDVLSGWDVAHFEAIATHGYAERLDRAFFPGLPLLLRAAGALRLPMGLAGAVIATACSLVAALALARLATQLARTAAQARILAPVAAGLWCFAPTTVFTSVAYTEAPFCAAAFWAWQRATQRHWGQATLLAALACSLRVSGIFLVGGLGLLALVGQCGRGARRLLDAATVSCALLVVVAYMVWLHHLTGSWNAWFEAQQSGWNRGFTHPADALAHSLDAARPSAWPERPLVAVVFGFEVVSMAVGLVLTVLLAVRRRWAEAGYVGVQVFAFATSYWFMSVNRAVLLWFPLWLLVAEAAAWAWAPVTAAAPGTPAAPGTGTPPPDGTARRLARAALVAGGAGSGIVCAWWAWQFCTGAWAS